MVGFIAHQPLLGYSEKSFLKLSYGSKKIILIL